MAALMLDPAGTATPEAPLVVTDRLTGCDVLGAVASQAVNVSATGASHSAPRTRDRSIIRTSPKGMCRPLYPPRVPMRPPRRVRHITSSWADVGVDLPSSHPPRHRKIAPRRRDQ